MKLEKIRFDRMEFAGALGDIGILIPLVVSLVAINGLNPTMILSLVGIFYIICGLYYRVPMSVQPLKAVAAIAIASGLGASVISAAGILMGIFLLFISVTGLAELLNRIFARPIIRGIQLGVGLMLIRTSLLLIARPINGAGSILLTNNMAIPFSWLVVAAGIIIMLIPLWDRQFPASIVILGLGLAASMFSGQLNGLNLSFFKLHKIIVTVPAKDDFIKALVLLVIPQIPLTLGNAVVATEDVAKRYFGEGAERVKARPLAFGMGIINIIAGFTGGMPVCHGSGGLTAHYSFGARTGGASVIIGSICLLLALMFGNGIGEIFKIIPHAILGIMLFYVGLKHALLITDLEKKEELFLALGIGVTAILTGNLAIAYGAGMSLWYFARFVRKSFCEA
ncbi:MAG: putative sulfate/molybdate transporter [Nitrospinota bacterium]|nr:putative sulfate/molybdate transporter [Nitrospinota bacterium]